MTIWRVITAAPHHELHVAAECRRGLGLLTLVPTERHRVRTRGKGGQPVIVTRERPLMAPYIFVGSRVGDIPWRDVMEIRHVRNVIQFAGEPALLNDREIERIRDLAKAVVDAGWQAGQRVTIADGPFKSIEALIAAVRDKTVTVTVPLFGSERDVELRVDQIEKVA